MAEEGDARVVAGEPHTRTHGVQPEAQAVAGLLLRYVGVRPDHLVDDVATEDPTGEQRSPEAVEVGERGVHAAVAVAAHRQVEHVGASVLEVAGGYVARELVRTQVAR